MQLLVLAKEPRPGRVKTRLCPPCTPTEAAALAEAALADTLAAVAAVDAEHIVVLDGRPGEWLPPGFRVVAQRGGDLDERLAAAWDDAGGPGLQIGMDTPQVTPALLEDGLDQLGRAGTDAVLGLAVDGGWWGIGLHQGRPDAFLGVPMSTPSTGRAQLRRLESLGLRTVQLPQLRDVDQIADAYAVAAEQPAGARFATAVATLRLDGARSRNPSCHGGTQGVPSMPIRAAASR